MAALSFPCPNCMGVLKSAVAIPAGKKIRCPKCGAVFPIPDADSGPKTPVVVKAKPRPKPKVVDEEEESVAEFDDENEAVAQFDDGDGDRDRDDEELSPRPRSKNKKKLKSAKKSKKGLMLILSITGMLILLLVGTFVAVKFLGGGVNKGTGNEDPLAYVPANASLVMGFDMESLMANPQMASQFEMGLSQLTGKDTISKIKQETGLTFQDLFSQFMLTTDQPLDNQTLVGGGANMKFTVIVKSKVKFDQQKLAKGFQAEKPQSLNGKYYYPISSAQYKTLYMPSDNIFVLTQGVEDLIKRLTSLDGTSLSIPTEVSDLIRTAQSGQIWGALPLTDAMRKQINEAPKEGMGADVESLNQAFSQSKAAGFWANIDPNYVKFNLGLACNDSGFAGQVSQDLSNAWNSKYKGALSFMLFALDNDVKKLVEEVINSVQISSQKNLIVASTKAGTKGLENLQKLIPQPQLPSGNQPGRGMGPAGFPGGGAGKPGSIPKGPGGN